MAEDVQVPVVGKLPQKKLLLFGGVAAVAFVGWRWWQSRQTADDTSTISDGEFGAVDSSIPDVLGAVSPTNSYGSDTGSDGDSTDTTGFTSNSQWTTYVRSQISDTYNDSDILAALGNFLAAKPTSTHQQTIVRAAIAVAGYPPVSGYALISGGDTAITVAPSGLKAITIRADHITMGWNAVAGATGYQLSAGGQSITAAGLTGTIGGLAAGTSYAFTVAALNGAGTPGPKSGAVSVKTAATATTNSTGPVGYGWQQIQRGENLKSFAERAGITEAALRGFNSATALKSFKIGSYLKVRSTANPSSGYKG